MTKTVQQVVTENKYLSDELKSAVLSISDLSTSGQMFVIRTLQDNWLSKDELDIAIRCLISMRQSFDAAERGDYSPLTNWLSSSLQDPDREFGRMNLILMPDVRKKLQDLKAPNEAWAALVDFESQLFPRLPRPELEAIVASQMLPFVRKIDFFSAFRQAYLLHEYEYDYGEWCQYFLELIKKNREGLGASEIQMDGRPAPQTISNWILDFTYFLKQPVEKAQAFDLAKYANNSQNTKSLNQNERKWLLNILEFYIWLYDPFVTEEDAKALGVLPQKSSSAKLRSVNSLSTENIDTLKAETQVPLPPKRPSIAATGPAQAESRPARKPVVQSPAKIKQMIEELELPAPKELPELGGVKKTGGFNQQDKSGLDFATELERIKQEVLAKRRQQEKDMQNMDGFKKSDSKSGDSDVSI